MSRYQKGKTNLDCTEARDSEWQWHQLGHMQVCTSLQTDNHASTPPLSFFIGRMPLLPPNQQRQSTEMPKMHQNMSGGRAPPGPAGGAYALPQKPKLGQPLASATKYLVYICILASNTTVKCFDFIQSSPLAVHYIALPHTVH